MQLTPKQRNTPPAPQSGSMITSIRQDMNELFDRFLEGRLDWPALAAVGPWAPTVDFTEEDRQFVLRAEVPGVDPKEVNVSINGSVLTICGEKAESSERREDDRYIRERTFGSFRRSIDLPPAADPERVNAACDNGVLTVTIGKLKNAEPRRIPIGKGA